MNGLEHQLCTELAKAADYCDIDLCLELIGKGTNVNYQDPQGCTPLFHAARNGHDDVIQSLIDSGAKLDTTNQNHWTPLMIAAHMGHINTVKTLCDAGAKRDLTDNVGHSALVYAVKNHNVLCAKILIQYGLTGSESKKSAYLALKFAAEYGQTSVIKALLNNGVEPDAHCCIIAANAGETEAVQVFLDNGLSVNARGRNNMTPLMAAAWGSATETVECLIKQGANPNLMSKDGNTAKDIAADQIKQSSGPKKEAYEHIIQALDIAVISSAFRTAADAGTPRKRRIHRPQPVVKQGRQYEHP
ncbi:MAG: ankyrin repeat domain-containing protein [Alphaproteobacteria bacterium]|nr:ankyrin repeat domain-containing protein [Alphaproteobacteria bacterium]